MTSALPFDDFRTLMSTLPEGDDAASDRVRTIRLPRWTQPPVRYQICVVRRPGVDSKGARRLIARVRGAKGRRILSAGGFGLPPRS